MRLLDKAALLALGAFIAAPALASDKRDFEACDGLVHPGRQDDGMRGAASRSVYATAIAGGRADAMTACTRALSSPRLLPTQHLRRAHLLRARAAAYLRAGKPAEALSDLDAAEAATTANAKDRFYQRSMAVSLDLLRALAHAHSGEVARAVPLAQTALAARPYSLQIQEVGANILQIARPVGAASPSPWQLAMKLDPRYRIMALAKEAEVGNFAGVLSLRPAVDVTWPAERLKPVALLTRDANAEKVLSAILVSLNTAYARAATGDPAGARRDLNDLRSQLAAARPEAEAPAGLNGSPFTAVDKYVEIRARQVEARIAVAEARPSDAIGTLVALPMPRDAATIELLTALKKVLPVKDAGAVPDIAAFEKELAESRRKALVGSVADALIAPETPRAVVDYEGSRPDILGALIGGAVSMGFSLLGGIDRTDGFRTTPNADGTVKVEFVGNTPSAPLVQEMTLLRAAEVTRAAGKSAFVITERKDFSRRMSTTRGGMEISSVATGFKTELTIRFVDTPAADVRAFDAVALIDALGPFYYEARKPAI